MGFRFGFLMLSGMTIILGLLPFGLSQSSEDAFMEIDMLGGQTENPFRIQDNLNQDIFAITPTGGITPIPVITTEVTLTTSLYSEWFPVWDVNADIGTTMPNAESGAGVYQYEYIVTAQDVAEQVDSVGLFSMDDFIPFISMTGQNLDGASVNLGAKLFVNDVERTTDTRTATGNHFISYWSLAMDDYPLNDNTYPYLSVGDVIGLKFWQSSGVADSFQLNNVVIMGLPNLTTDAQSWAIGEHNFVKSPNRVIMDVPSPITGVTASGLSNCLQAYSYNFQECIGDNFFGVSQGVQGMRVIYDISSSNLSSGATNFFVVTSESEWLEGSTIIVNTWRK